MVPALEAMGKKSLFLGAVGAGVIFSPPASHLCDVPGRGGQSRSQVHAPDFGTRGPRGIGVRRLVRALCAGCATGDSRCVFFSFSHYYTTQFGLRPPLRAPLLSGAERLETGGRGAGARMKLVVNMIMGRCCAFLTSSQ